MSALKAKYADLVERLVDESDLCKADGADDIAALLTEAAEFIDLQVARINHLMNVNEGLRETLDLQRNGLAELKAMISAGNRA